MPRIVLFSLFLNILVNKYHEKKNSDVDKDIRVKYRNDDIDELGWKSMLRIKIPFRYQNKAIQNSISVRVSVVYRLRTKNLRFVAPMPEQMGTPTMHFPEVSGP